MLRNTRIRTRLALMAIAPALTALILAGITFALVPSISIGGSAYNQILVGKDFQQNTISPHLYIIEIHDQVQQLALAGLVNGQTEDLETGIAAGRKAYEEAYHRWSVRPLADGQARADLDISYKYAQEYFQLYQKQLLPAVHNHTRQGQTAVDILNFQMASKLNSHKLAVQEAAGLVGKQVAEHEKSADARVQQQQLGIVGITLLLVAASIAVGITVLRSITERVRRLNVVATVELPQMLVEVQRAAAAGEEIPSMETATPEGNDELSAAAGAFNSVVATAVEMAAEQSRLRRATSQMFINLGRRNHKLLSRTLTYITQLESDERDPSTLQNLFRLDHLATRMRRHAESLLVLAGSPPLRTWSRPVPVSDVLRAALSEIETYDRVDIKELEPVEVRGASVSDLAHLLAELLENATAFSPPQTRVRVLGRNDSDGYTVVVVDEGIGMSPEELAAANSLISSAERSGILNDSRMLGLGVVGRLAARHGFRVNVTASPVGGVVAWVTLPHTALAPRRGNGEPEAIPSAPAPVAIGPSEVPVNAGGAASLAAPTVPAPARSGPGNGRQLAPGPAPDSLPMRPALQPQSRAALDPGARADVRAEVRAGEPAQGRTPGRAPLPAGSGREGRQGPESWDGREGRDRQLPRDVEARRVDDPGARTATGSIILPPPAPQLGAASGRPAAPGEQVNGHAAAASGASVATGPIAFRKPVARPGGGGGLTRRVRGAQLPDTGESTSGAGSNGSAEPRPQRSAQSVRGALASFSAGRRTASEVTIGNAAELRRGEPRPVETGPPAAAAPAPSAQAAPAEPRMPAGPGPVLPRRVRGAQMPQTDLPTSAPAPERSAAEVRAALSNFVAGRRAAEHQD